MLKLLRERTWLISSNFKNLKRHNKAGRVDTFNFVAIKTFITIQQTYDILPLSIGKSFYCQHPISWGGYQIQTMIIMALGRAKQLHHLHVLLKSQNGPRTVWHINTTTKQLFLLKI